MSGRSNNEQEWLGRETVGELQIVASTIFFGVSFVGQRFAMLDGQIGPITFNAFRYLVSTILLFILKPVLSQYSSSPEVIEEHAKMDADDQLSMLEEDGYVPRGTDALTGLFGLNNRRVWGRGGLYFWIIISGLSNYAGSMLQQFGLVSVSAGKVGFITGSYVVIIPFIEWLLPGFHGHPIACVSWKVWIGALLCFFGLYFISGCADNDTCLDSSTGQGEILVFISVFFWIINLMCADAASKRVDCLDLTIGEFCLVTTLTIISSLLFESESWKLSNLSLLNHWPIILMVGFTEAMAFLFSTIGQTYVNPSRAAILYSCGESLAACLLGMFFLGEHMSTMERVGGGVMVLACILSSSSVSDEEEDDEKENEERRRARTLSQGNGSSNGNGSKQIITYNLIGENTHLNSADNSYIIKSYPTAYGATEDVL